MKLKLTMPKLTRWDLIAMLVVGLGLALMAVQVAQGGAGSGLFAFLQLVICLGSLMVLGKTAKEGTLWGNLAAVTGMFVGMGGVLLAAALWAVA